MKKHSFSYPLVHMLKYDIKLSGARFCSNTVCTRDSGHSSWESIYKYFEDEEPKVTVRTIMVDDKTPTSKTTPQDATNSFLYKIGARPRLFSYTDMIRWVVDTVNIIEWKFHTQKGSIIGSFTAKDLQAMYHLPDPQCIYKREYVQDLIKKNGEPADSIGDWRKDSNKHKTEESGEYSINSITSPFSQIVLSRHVM